MADHSAPTPDRPALHDDARVLDAALALLGLDAAAHDTTAHDAAAHDAARALVATATVGAALAAGDAGVAPVAPPPELRGRLLDRIRREPFQFVHADEGRWTPVAGDPAATAKLLYQGAHPGERTRLVRLPAGDARAALADARDPALLVVAGELWLGATRCARGDFAEPDTSDAEWRAAAPTTVLVVERPGGVAARRASAAGAWRPIAPGTRVRPLAGGHGAPVDVMLLEMEPGGVLPEHEHGGLEEIFLLRGSCRAQGRRLAAGDYHRAGRGSEHETTTTDEGCLMLVVLRRAA